MTRDLLKLEEGTQIGGVELLGDRTVHQHGHQVDEENGFTVGFSTGAVFDVVHRDRVLKFAEHALVGLETVETVFQFLGGLVLVDGHDDEVLALLGELLGDVGTHHRTSAAGDRAQNDVQLFGGFETHEDLFDDLGLVLEVVVDHTAVFAGAVDLLEQKDVLGGGTRQVGIRRIEEVDLDIFQLDQLGDVDGSSTASVDGERHFRKPF